MRLDQYMKENGYRWSQAIRKDAFTHLQNDTEISTIVNSLGSVNGLSDMEYTFEVLKRREVIVPTYYKAEQLPTVGQKAKLLLEEAALLLQTAASLYTNDFMEESITVIKDELISLTNDLNEQYNG